METITSQEFWTLVEDEWEVRMREEPLTATLYGDHRYNDQLGHVTPADFQRRLVQLEQFQRRGLSIERSELSPADTLNYDIFMRLLAGAIGELRYGAHYFPVSKTDAFYNFLLELHQFVPLDNAKDLANYVARLNAFHSYAQEMIELMRHGLALGFRPARPTLEGVTDRLRLQIVARAEDCPLFAPFLSTPSAESTPMLAEFAGPARQAILGSVLPGLQALMAFLENEYVPAARESVGVVDLPEGEAFYQHRIRYLTTLDLTPLTIHQTGQAEVQRIRQEMDAIIDQVQFEGDFPEFVELLRHDPRFYARDAQELLARTALVLKRMDGELPRLFATLPRTPYGIREIPAYSAPGNTTAYYFPSPGDGTRAGFYYVNTYDLPSRPLYEIEALSLHEAVPGHHLQIALQQELGELPNFRRQGGFTAFVEGWALYSERLGLETGFYTDPYSNFGRLSYEMWRACRLVVDTGIHALGWTRQQAIDFMAANSSLTLLNITNEVDRYISWPGQALAYKLGEMKIRALRARAEAALGDRFDLRRFHDLLLGEGALPLDVLEQKVIDWIDTQL